MFLNQILLSPAQRALFQRSLTRQPSLVCYRHLELAILIVLAELFVGSKGYLFYVNIFDQKISVRLALFVVIFLIWLIWLLRGRAAEFFRSDWLKPYLVLFLFLIIAGLNGFLNFSFAEVFWDLNGWLYFLLAPVLFYFFSQPAFLKNFWSLWLAAITFLSLKTLVVEILFSVWSMDNLTIFYQWLRNSGVGEITFVTGSFYRVFFQAHLYLLLGLVFIIWLLLNNRQTVKNRKGLWLILILTSLALLISSSRSFFVGWLFGFITLLLVDWLKNRKNWQRPAKIILLSFIIFNLEVGVLNLAFAGFYASLTGSRLQNPALEAAGSSRLQQLAPLNLAIQQHWLFGSGFGQAVTYTSDDPRIRQQHPDGRYSATAFEWGYLDIWLKTGLLGLLAYFWLLIKIIRQSPILPFLGIGLIALAFTNVFSPYLNHPLGIGYVLMASAIIFSLKQNYGEVGEINR